MIETMKHILIISKQQFGYLTDVVKWTESMKRIYRTSVLCFDKGYKRRNMEDVDVMYVPYSRYYAVNAARFYACCVANIARADGVIVEYFKGCSFLKKIFRRKSLMLDIRTLSVSGNPAEREAYNGELKETCRLYDHVTVISQGIKDFMSDVDVPVSILPLGAETISSVRKRYDEMKLLYVGTLSGRDIHKTILGFDRFCRAHPDTDVIYHIVGEGDTPAETVTLKLLIKQLGLSDKILMHGRMPYDELRPFFDECNIGVSFVPMTSYYDDQPVTKTFEYAMSGLFTIATATKENKKVISHANGLLIDDNPGSFYDALENISRNNGLISDKAIRDSVAEYSWDTLMEKYLLPVIDSIF